jgi:hypothetical protein
MAERYMRTIEDMLSSFVGTRQKDWDKYIHLIMMAYRSSVHERTGISPCRMMFGHEINLPVDLVLGRPFQEKVNENAPIYVRDLENIVDKVHAFARSHMNMSSDVMKKTYDHKIHKKLHNSGDPVWYYQYQRKVGLNPKLLRPWHGPFVIIERLNDVMYRIKLSSKSKPKIVHYDKLKHYVDEYRPTWFTG